MSRPSVAGLTVADLFSLEAVGGWFWVLHRLPKPNERAWQLHQLLLGLRLVATAHALGVLVYGEKNLNQEFSFAEATKVRALLVDLVETTLAPSVIGELLTLLAAEQAAGGSAT